MCTQCPLSIALPLPPSPPSSAVVAVNQAIRQSVSHSGKIPYVVMWQTSWHVSSTLLSTILWFYYTHTHMGVCLCVCVYLCLNVSDSFMVICMHLCCVNADENAWGLGLWLWLGDFVTVTATERGNNAGKYLTDKATQRRTLQMGGWKRLWTASKWSSIWCESRKERLFILWSSYIHNSQVYWF